LGIPKTVEGRPTATLKGPTPRVNGPKRESPATRRFKARKRRRRPRLLGPRSDAIRNGAVSAAPSQWRLGVSPGDGVWRRRRREGPRVDGAEEFRPRAREFNPSDVWRPLLGPSAVLGGASPPRGGSRGRTIEARGSEAPRVGEKRRKIGRCGGSGAQLWPRSSTGALPWTATSPGPGGCVRSSAAPGTAGRRRWSGAKRPLRCISPALLHREEGRLAVVLPGHGRAPGCQSRGATVSPVPWLGCKMRSCTNPICFRPVYGPSETGGIPKPGDVFSRVDGPVSRAPFRGQHLEASDDASDDFSASPFDRSGPSLFSAFFPSAGFEAPVSKRRFFGAPLFLYAAGRRRALDVCVFSSKVSNVLPHQFPCLLVLPLCSPWSPHLRRRDHHRLSFADPRRRQPRARAAASTAHDDGSRLPAIAQDWGRFRRYRRDPSWAWDASEPAWDGGAGASRRGQGAKFGAEVT